MKAIKATPDAQEMKQRLDYLARRAVSAERARDDAELREREARRTSMSSLCLRGTPTRGTPGITSGRGGRRFLIRCQ